MSDVIKVSYGDSKTIPILIRDKHNNLAPLPLAGTDVRVYFSVKERLEDGDDRIIIEKDTLGGGLVIDNDPSTGLVYVYLTPGDTGKTPMNYKYDVRVYIDGEVFSQLPEDFIIQQVVKRVIAT